MLPLPILFPFHILSMSSKIDFLLYPVIICALFLCFRFVCVDRFFFLVSKETTSESLVDGVADRLTAMIPDNSLFNTFIHPSTHTEKGTLIDNPTTGLKCC